MSGSYTVTLLNTTAGHRGIRPYVRIELLEGGRFRIVLDWTPPR